MTHRDDDRFVITRPGVLVFGGSLPAGTIISSYFHDETVIQVSCGGGSYALVCASGRVYTLDSNQGNEQTENDEDQCDAATLVDALSTVRITQVACGEGHTMFTTDQGELYSCGMNDCGQLGLGHNDNTPALVLVPGLPPVKKFAVGSKHTAVLADGGEVWVCGDNSWGQLGLGHEDEQTSFIRVPDLAEEIVDVSCSGYHTALVTASGRLLMTGCNQSGELGLGAVGSTSRITRVSVPLAAVAAVSCGYDHTVALRADGTTWAWGRNDCGQLGTGDTADRSTPTRMVGLADQIVFQVVAGCHNTAVLTQAGDVFVCGWGEEGVLGQGKQNLLVPTVLPKSKGLIVQQVAFGERYSLLLVVSAPSVTLPQQLGYESAERGDYAGECITDWEQSIIRSLECPVCMKIMCAPIHLCSKGHSLCNTCRSDDTIKVCPLCRARFISVRNVVLEGLVADIRLPCTECLVRMPACELGPHGSVCPRRDYECPLACGSWRGRPEAMLAHARSAHPDRTWSDLPRTFVQRPGLLFTDVLAAHGRTFTLHRGYDDEGRTFRAGVRFIGTPEDRLPFTFKFTVVVNDMHLTYFKNVCSDIESVEDMFRSSECVIVKREFLDTFLQNDNLTCRAAILKV